MTEKLESGYASVNGIELYYEVRGEGEPLILLHGGAGASEMFGPNLTLLAETRRVIAVHQQGHGHTADVDRPLRCELMADDVAALIPHLGFERIDLMGYSMGGGVALQTAIRHPQVVRKLVIVSTPAKHDASYPEVLDAFEQMVLNAASIAEGVRRSPLNELYPGKDWETLFAKSGDMLSQDYDWSSEVAEISSPTMIVFADADSIRPEHIVEFYGLLGGGERDAGLDGSLRSVARLAILPGTTHYDIASSPALVPAVVPFLDAPISERTI